MYKLLQSTSLTSIEGMPFSTLTYLTLCISEQEHNRTQESSNVDDRTQHEVYARPFIRSVQAGTAIVMCSYSTCNVSSSNAIPTPILTTDLINDTYACENDKTLNDILKREFGFQGFVISDWGAQHSTLSAVAGLDVCSPVCHFVNFRF